MTTTDLIGYELTWLWRGWIEHGLHEIGSDIDIPDAQAQAPATYLKVDTAYLEATKL
jgi:hypothetical protein